MTSYSIDSMIQNELNRISNVTDEFYQQEEEIAAETVVSNASVRERAEEEEDLLSIIPERDENLNGQFSLSNGMSTIVNEESTTSYSNPHRTGVKFNIDSTQRANPMGISSPSRFSTSLQGASSTMGNTSVFVPPSSNRYRITARSNFDTSTKCVILKELRPTAPTDLRKLRDLAVEHLNHKFDLVPFDNSEKQILNNYNLQMRVKELKRNLVKYDIDDVFKIIQFSPTLDVDRLLEASIPIQPLEKKLDLLEEWDQIKEEEIIRHVKFLRLYGQNWDLQNLLEP